jgi:hypothetical protein
MDPQIPTSFIPKRPVLSDAPVSQPRNHVVGLLTVVTVIVALATIISGAGVYLFQKSLASQKQDLELKLNEARNGIGTDFLSDMKRLNARILGVQSLLKEHIVVSPIFAALEETTLRSIQYKTFSYAMKTDQVTKQQVVEVKLTGTARNYSTIALQSDAFAQSSLIKNPVFSGLTVEDKTGNVSFQLTFDVAPRDLSFETFISDRMKTVPGQSAPVVENPASLLPEVTTP